MSLLSSSDHAVDATASPETRSSSALVENAVAVGYLATVGVATMGWLYVLAVVVWDGASWLLS